ncbi:tryptophan--tRNA ligase [Candidatus Azambacteria bacterium]|nr:tryptophan--tRNA ligase [Candidatus Azambacteria bacterium]
MKKRILTGDRPTGSLHLGHYVGSLQNRIQLQSDGYEMFNIIADLQVLTDRLDTKDVEKNIRELVLDYLSVGIDPKKTNIFIQSRVSQLSELFVYLSMLVNVGRVGQNPTVKEETKATGGGNMSLGMFSLGVSQSADILAFNADLVPVGEDQLPHIEQARDLVRSFNHNFGDVFREPEAMLSKTPRLLGLDAQNKMSKSRGNAIFLSDTKEVVEKKIKTAVTDSDSSVRYDEEKKPEVSNLIMMYHLFSDMSIDEIVKKYEGVKSYKEFKEDLAEVINKFLDPIRERREQAEKEEDIARILRDGTQRAIEETEKTMQKVRKAMKYEYRSIF